jgi:membrane protein YqaA with SNARE-associated domain
MELGELPAHAALFMAALLSATLLPGSSEAMLIALVAREPASAASYFIVATIGNTLGAVINWCLGRWLSRYAESPWFPTNPRRLAEVSRLFQKYGTWMLLFSWLPVVGDPLTVAAGVLRVPFPIFATLVAVGKAARYLALIWGLQLIQVSIDWTKP